MLKIGVLGTGNLGELHVQKIQQMDSFELIGVYDSDYDLATHISSKYNIPRFSNANELLNKVDAVNVVTPTKTHFSDVVQALRQSKHVFIENPISHTVDEAKRLLILSAEADVKVQIGYVERFNPAYSEARAFIFEPLYIESHRLMKYDTNNQKESIVYDIMIHDIDIILNTVKSYVKKVRASGVPIINKSLDIVNARLEFDNGCVANLTASRVSTKNIVKTRFFQKGASVYLDYLKRKVDLLNVTDKEMNKITTSIDCEKGKYGKEFGIKMQLQNFYQSIVNNTKPEVTIEDSYDTLQVAHLISQRLEGHY